VAWSSAKFACILGRCSHSVAAVSHIMYCCLLLQCLALSHRAASERASGDYQEIGIKCLCAHAVGRYMESEMNTARVTSWHPNSALQLSQLAATILSCSPTCAFVLLLCWKKADSSNSQQKRRSHEKKCQGETCSTKRRRRAEWKLYSHSRVTWSRSNWLGNIFYWSAKIEYWIL
jgi:hypothetical protein